LRSSIALAVLALACVSRGGQTPPQSHYDVVVLGSGLKESLLAGLLASHGRSVLHLGADDASTGAYDLQQLVDAVEGPGTELSEQKLGKPSEYSVERSPKMFMAGGDQLQLLVACGAWQHMNPPGFKRVQRSLLYRRRPDGSPDVHRVLANSEDVLKTRMLSALDKARMVQFFLWIERYDEDDERTHLTNPLSKRSLDLRKMSAFKFLAFWELPAEAVNMVTRGMALHAGPAKRLKRMPAIEMVRKLKRYKDSYRTFPHMTSPYVYPVGGFGASLPRAMAHVVEAHGGSYLADTPVDEILQEEGSACGVAAQGARVSADCVVASPEMVPDRVAPQYEMVRLFAVLAHPPNMCKDATSCQLLMPAVHCGRAHDIYLRSFGPAHGVAPKGRWVVVVTARVEGSTAGMDAMAVAKRELAAVLPLLKPTRKMFAEVVPYMEPAADAQLDRLLILKSCDETSYFDSVEADVADLFQRITGEDVASLRQS